MKHLSPLRYPGGKIQLFNLVKGIINKFDLNKKIYVEPFAGGFGLGLALLNEDIIKRAIINDYDFHIYALWKEILRHPKRLCAKINEVSVTLEEFFKQKEIFTDYTNYDIDEVAFSTLFLNRTTFSGVIKGGPLGGLEQKSKYTIDCRFNKKSLIEKIEYINSIKDKIELYNFDAVKFINKTLIPFEKDLFINFDPPYYAKGKDLYFSFYDDSDHENLSKVIKTNLNNINWIITYDNEPFIKKLYKDFKTEEIKINYSANQKITAKEILISNF